MDCCGVAPRIYPRRLGEGFSDQSSGSRWVARRSIRLRAERKIASRRDIMDIFDSRCCVISSGGIKSLSAAHTATAND